ncbi:RNA polymerase recycling motor HelD [Cytobacillus gottheilii]|uniref:RNA polymerase recycling motor HelD n=1 Tax=Cytobacillus gottheilii TaxID=859144 RepID=UPI0009BC3B3F|nr:RNA polymerase recycling motor HelD [Cytobacillus gottheilii]
MSEELNKKQEEQQRVNLVVKEIKEKIKQHSGLTDVIGSEAQHLKQTFWEDVTVNLDEPDDVIETFTSMKQQAELLAERERSKDIIDQQLRTLVRLEDSPYFARIDFHEDGEKEAEPIYIGIASLMDQNNEEFLIYDWRAPISSLYYDFSPGEAEYKTPSGLIHGEMTLKRQFMIKSGEITAMFDTGLTIGDQMLQEVLGGQNNAKMKSIVATIQKEQNALIRNEKSQILVVQGAAGSGKTSAALQRAAFLLYRHRDTLQASNILFLSPNPLFNSYVSSVLPELGEENTEQMTYQEYVKRRLSGSFDIEDPFDQLEELLISSNSEHLTIRLEEIQYKSQTAFKTFIDEYISSLSNKGLLFKDIVFKGRRLITAQDLYQQFYQYDQALPIPNRIQLLQEWLLKEIRQLEKKERKASWVQEEIELLDREDYLEAFQHMQKKEDDFADLDQEEKYLINKVVSQTFKPLKNYVKKLKYIDFKKLYRELFTRDNTASYWEHMKEKTINEIDKNCLSYEDATAFLYLKDHIEGRKTNGSIKHIFIDEAQDYSPFQFAYLRFLFPYSKLTLLGDINQAIYWHSLDRETIFPGEEAEFLTLTKSYRSTKQIGQFTSSFIANGHLIEPFDREGEMPLAITATEDMLYPSLIENIEALQQKGFNNIAVITKTAKKSAEIYQSIREQLTVHLIEKTTTDYVEGVQIIPAYLAKGIEFDAVIVIDADDYTEERERKLFYTACTRAMHELCLFQTKETNIFLKEADQSSYRKVVF